MEDTSITPFGDLSKPADTLIKKVSNAVGGLFKPYQIVRVAKAEAEAARIQAQAQIQITDLQRRAMHRFLEEESRKQLNIEEITRRALPMLEDASEPERLSDDWIVNFFDKARLVSDDHMQQLWSHILAGEANSPGSFSKKTVNVVGDMDKHDADLFTQLCRFAWDIGGRLTPLLFSSTAKLYNDVGLHFGTLTHLESLGLLRMETLTGFVRTAVPKVFEVTYFHKHTSLHFPKEADNQLGIGIVLLTTTGQELTRLCAVEPIAGFVDYVLDHWKQHLPPPPTLPTSDSTGT
jgi:Protein of unknown function (DUF2806)